MNRVHLSAIGGTGMGSLAGLLTETGVEVRGSDNALYPPMSDILNELKIPVAKGFSPKNLDWGPDLLVLGNACRLDHVEYLEAKRRNIPVMSFPELLGSRFLQGKKNIVVTGTHGKTTTSSLVAHLLRVAGKNPGFLIGGVPRNMKRGFAAGSGDYFVVEGDEYDSASFDKRPKFVHYPPQILIITGIEYDHADIYSDLEQIESLFADLVQRVPATGRLLVAGDSEPARKICADRPGYETYRTFLDAIPYSVEGERTTWEGICTRNDKRASQLMDVRYGGRDFGEFDLPLTGEHNSANALAAIAAAYHSGVSQSVLASGISSFRGVSRRQELRGVEGNISIIDDFAHHPTAVRQTLRGLRGVYGSGRLIAVFEPRSAASRRNVFQSTYAEALAEADHVFVGPLYQPEAIPAPERFDVDRLVNDVKSLGRRAERCTHDELPLRIADASAPGDTVVVMSSGSFNNLIERLLTLMMSSSNPSGD